MSEPPTRIPLAGGDEQDVFTRARRFYCYTQRPGVCARIKAKYNRRLRRIVRLILRRSDAQ